MFGFLTKEKKEMDSPLETKSSPISAYLGYGLFEKSTNNLKQLLTYYLENSPVSTGVDIITESFAGITPVLYDKLSEEYINQHPFLDLLEKPNPFSSSDLFLKELASYFILTGNGFLTMTGNINKPPLELYNYCPTSITIQANDYDGHPHLYTYQAYSNAINYFRDKNYRYVNNSRDGEVAHIREFNPNYSRGNLYGASILDACEVEIVQYLYASLHNAALLQNGGRPSGILSYKGATPLTAEQFQLAKKQITDMLQGARNAGSVSILGGEFKWFSLTETIRDMDFKSLRKEMTTTIFNRLRIPLPFISQESMTYSNLQSSRLILYDNVILPFTKKIYGFLEKKVLSRFPDAERYSLVYDEASIDVLKLRTSSNVKDLFESGIYTYNEIRSVVGMESVEGGDILTSSPNTGAPMRDVYTEDNRQTPVDSKNFKSILQKRKKADGTPYYTEFEIKSLVDEYYK